MESSPIQVITTEVWTKKSQESRTKQVFLQTKHILMRLIPRIGRTIDPDKVLEREIILEEITRDQTQASKKDPWMRSSELRDQWHRLQILPEVIKTILTLGERPLIQSTLRVQMDHLEAISIQGDNRGDLTTKVSYWETQPLFPQTLEVTIRPESTSSHRTGSRSSLWIASWKALPWKGTRFSTALIARQKDICLQKTTHWFLITESIIQSRSCNQQI